MKKFLILFVCALLISCASKGQTVDRKVTPDQYYRVSGYAKALVISGSLETVTKRETPTKRILKVFINNDVAINENLIDDNDELKGRWKNKKVSAACYSKNNNLRCLIYVCNERTVTLSF